MNACIGIISYLPDNKSIRDVRKQRVENLIAQCDLFYKLPIIVIAQNWLPNEVKVSRSCNIFNYPKLGITNARKELRRMFLFSRYDYIIMLDDDMELYPSVANAEQYLDLIYKSGQIFEYENFLVNMMGIPRTIFQQVDFDPIDPEKGEGFEDWIFVEKLKTTFPNSYNNIRSIKLLARNRHDLVSDTYSTWITPDTDKRKMDFKSRSIINGFKRQV